MAAVLERQLELHPRDVGWDATLCDGRDDGEPVPGPEPRRADVGVLEVEDRRSEGLEVLGRLGREVDYLFSVYGLANMYLDINLPPPPLPAPSPRFPT